MSKVRLTDEQVSRFFGKLNGRPEAHNAPAALDTIEEWPNRMGFDVGPVEIWKHTDAFRCFTDAKVLHVPYAVTTDPLTAARLCVEQGLDRGSLDDMEPTEAQALYMATGPVL
jgi:hypothetical protein